MVVDALGSGQGDPALRPGLASRHRETPRASDQRGFVWTNDTKINGTLAVGARVTIRFTTLPDGQNLAHQISVTKS